MTYEYGMSQFKIMDSIKINKEQNKNKKVNNA
jgi:hypothetical protein